MNSKVYKKELRSLMKKAVRIPSRTSRSHRWQEWKESRLRSQEVESQLKRDKLSRHNEINIVMQGSNSARLMVMAQMKDMHKDQFTREERLDYRERLQARTIDSILSFLTFVRSCAPLPEVLAGGEVNIHPSAPSYSRSATLEAIDTLWNSCGVSQYYKELRGNIDQGKDI